MSVTLMIARELRPERLGEFNRFNQLFTVFFLSCCQWSTYELPMRLETSAELESAIHRFFQHEQLAIETRRKELGVTDALKQVPGIIAPMLVPLGESGIKTVEDLAACATDDLYGWAECRGRRIKQHHGILQDVVVSRAECDAIILRARALVGWIDEPKQFSTDNVVNGPPFPAE
jgi:hypothetical protein